jgi:hypothetical protein
MVGVRSFELWCLVVYKAACCHKPEGNGQSLTAVKTVKPETEELNVVNIRHSG